MDSIKSPIVFFDSHCLLCNGSVQFILRHEKQHTLFFAPYGGRTYQQNIGIHPQQNIPDSIVVFHNNQIYYYSKAIILILINMGSYWKFLGNISNIIPPVVFDYFYKLIANNRYKWFGTTNSCMIPEQKNRYRILE
ncbi:MAG: DUF393 domain-containing protein [Bacteroidetes bacterium]|nr:DUF393 domain-containing protein [Bacteroidota bacterium]